MKPCEASVTYVSERWVPASVDRTAVLETALEAVRERPFIGTARELTSLVGLGVVLRWRDMRAG